MTRQELDAIWQRYMHRTDLVADLDEVFDRAGERIQERLLFATVDLADILENAPRMYVHAGLVYLHELSQDDEGGARETQLLQDAVRDYSLRTSINNASAPQMADPYRSYEDAS